MAVAPDLLIVLVGIGRDHAMEMTDSADLIDDPLHQVRAKNNKRQKYGNLEKELENPISMYHLLKELSRRFLLVCRLLKRAIIFLYQQHISAPQGLTLLPFSSRGTLDEYTLEAFLQA